ncbi:MAG: hypothetical protein JNM24_17650 [Bdellovibrionaceae bacterium]|nr:hypothetical protein [Pseudobdellovibrionaceae bacterium]
MKNNYEGLKMEEKHKLEIKKPTGRFADLDKKGFAVMNIKYSNITHDRSLVQISKTIWALKPEGTELILGAVNEFTDAPENVKEIAMHGDERFFHVTSENDFHKTLLNWKAESHVVTFFKKNEFSEVFTIISDFGNNKSSSFGFEGDYLLGFGKERLTIFISDTHDSIEIWSSEANLKTVLGKLR